MNLSVLERSTLEVFPVTCLIDDTTILRVIKKKHNVNNKRTVRSKLPTILVFKLPFIKITC